MAPSACCRQIQKSIEAKYHLNEPLWRQYLRYLADLARGDLGPSFQYRSTSVNEIIAQGLPVDATIGFTAIAIAAAGRRGGGRERRAAPWHALGLRHHGARGRRHLHPGVRRGAAADIDLRHQAALAARRGLGTRLPVAPAAAGGRTGAALHRLRRAPDARQHHRSAQQRLHPHRARQGPAAAADHLAPRTAADIDAAGVVSRAGDRRRGHRLDRGRDCVRPAGHRPLLHHRCAQSRLHPGDRHHGAVWRADHPVQSAGRPVLRMDRPARAARDEPAPTPRRFWRPGAAGRLRCASAPRMVAGALLALHHARLPADAAVLAVRLLHPGLPAAVAQPDARRRTHARHRPAGSRPAGAGDVGLPHLARGRPGRQPGERADRCALGRDRRLCRRRRPTR